ncbi:MAG: tRNA lysidine(34) synthetase TilS [Bacteroidales bacterium]|nr:tRNA lysidine(34) synthetase TilS [Bacteroidales bacterium]
MQQFLAFINANSLIDNNDKLLLSVSGGRDSVLLCKLFYDAGFKFDIAHCNYHLRGEDSDRDEQFVRTLAGKYHAQIHVTQFDTNNYAENTGNSVEMAARQLRYDWYVELCKSFGYTKIATAHHLNDQTETFFINLLRSTGINGIRGIPLKRPIKNTFVNGKQCCIIRPMMFLSRREINEYTKDIEYMDDYTNFSDKYVRNFIRLNVIPKIEELDPNFPATLQKSIKQFDCTAKYITKLTAEKFPKTADHQGNTIIDIPADYDTDELRGYLYFALDGYGFNLKQLKKIACSINSTGSRFYSNEFELLINRRQLLVRQKQSSPEQEYFINENDEELTIPLNLKFSRISREQITSLKCDDNTAMLDFDRLKFPLRLSKGCDGDYFYPLGMRGKKKLSDFYIDKKIDNFTKSSTFALWSENNIVWIVGHRIDDRYKITDSTKWVYKIELS